MKPLLCQLRSARRCIVVGLAFLLSWIAAGCQHSADSESSADASHKERSPENGKQLASNDPAQALQQAVQYLLSVQHDDGLWRSEYYGNLKSGAATTAFILYALAHAKDDLDNFPQAEFDKAFLALQEGILKNGYVSNDDGPDYSNYGSAMYLMAALRTGKQIPEEIESRLIDYLIRSQLDEAEGFEPTDRDYGGWDLSGWMTGPRRTTGSNISVTSSVLEALVAYAPIAYAPIADAPIANAPNSGAPIADNTDAKQDAGRKLLNRMGRSSRHYDKVIPAIEKGIQWLYKCQNFDDASEIKSEEDGGFYFHPELDHDGNKAAWLDEQRASPRSYGSTTADGFRTTRMLGTLVELLEPSEAGPSLAELKKRGDRAADWLAKHPNVERVPGFDWETGDHGWNEGLLFYFWYSRSKCFAFEPADEARATGEKITQLLLARQKADGSWQNRVARMREDDPLIATCFAIIALSETTR